MVRYIIRKTKRKIFHSICSIILAGTIQLSMFAGVAHLFHTDGGALNVQGATTMKTQGS